MYLYIVNIRLFLNLERYKYIEVYFFGILKLYLLFLFYRDLNTLIFFKDSVVQEYKSQKNENLRTSQSPLEGKEAS